MPSLNFLPDKNRTSDTHTPFSRTWNRVLKAGENGPLFRCFSTPLPPSTQYHLHFYAKAKFFFAVTIPDNSHVQLYIPTAFWICRHRWKTFVWVGYGRSQVRTLGTVNKSGRWRWRFFLKIERKITKSIKHKPQLPLPWWPQEDGLELTTFQVTTITFSKLWLDWWNVSLFRWLEKGSVLDSRYNLGLWKFDGFITDARFLHSRGILDTGRHARGNIPDKAWGTAEPKKAVVLTRKLSVTKIDELQFHFNPPMVLCSEFDVFRLPISSLNMNRPDRYSFLNHPCIWLTITHSLRFSLFIYEVSHTLRNVSSQGNARSCTCGDDGGEKENNVARSWQDGCDLSGSTSRQLGHSPSPETRVGERSSAGGKELMSWRCRKRRNLQRTGPTDWRGECGGK